MALEQYFRNAEEENCSLQQCLTVLLRNICLNPFFFFFETGFLLLPFLVSRRDLGWKSQGWFIHIKKHLLRGTRLSCLLQGQSIISRCLLVCQKSSIEQFHSIKKYLKEWFLSTFLYIIDSAPKAKKQTNKSLFYKRDDIRMQRKEAVRRQNHKNRNQLRRRLLLLLSRSTEGKQDLSLSL